jgi:hypothetical protein
VNGDPLAESHSILNEWKNFMSQLLNVQSVSYIGQIVKLSAVPYVPGHCPFETGIAFAK